MPKAQQTEKEPREAVLAYAEGAAAAVEDPPGAWSPSVRAHAELVDQLERCLQLPVEIDTTGMVADIELHFMWGAYGIVPCKVCVACGTSMDGLLVSGRDVLDLSRRYNRALYELRRLRDRFAARYTASLAPDGADVGQAALSRLEADIEARQTTRLRSRVLSRRFLDGETSFWETYHAYLEKIVSRAERAAHEATELEPPDRTTGDKSLAAATTRANGSHDSQSCEVIVQEIDPMEA